MKYTVRINLTEYFTYDAEIEANSAEEAIKIAEELHEKEPIDLMRNTYEGSELNCRLIGE
jgi:hypothetical protein